MALYGLASEVTQKHVLGTLVVKAVINLPRFKGREHKPYLLMEEVSNNLLSYFKTATPFTKEDNSIMGKISPFLGYVSKTTMVINIPPAS